MEPTYAHTCVKGIKLAAGELSDSTEEDEVEAMEMYARLAEAEDPRDFEQTLQEARKRALQEENEIQQSIETLEELAREHVNDSLAVMEYRYELRQMSKFGFLSGLISAPRAHVERNVAKAVLQGSPKNLRTALMVLSTFPPVRYPVSPLRRVIGGRSYVDKVPHAIDATRLFGVRHRGSQHAQVADKESKLAAAATTLYNLARAVAPKFTDDTPEWS